MPRPSETFCSRVIAKLRVLVAIDPARSGPLRAKDPLNGRFPDTPRSTDSANTKSEYRRLKAHNGPDLNRMTAVMAYLTAAGLNFGRYAVVTAVI